MKKSFRKKSTRERISENNQRVLIDVLDSFYNARGEVLPCGEPIMQALIDSATNSKKPEERYAKSQAISWLSGTSKDFSDVCSYANLEYAYVIDKAQKFIV